MSAKKAKAGFKQQVETVAANLATGVSDPAKVPTNKNSKAISADADYGFDEVPSADELALQQAELQRQTEEREAQRKQYEARLAALPANAKKAFGTLRQFPGTEGATKARAALDHALAVSDIANRAQNFWVITIEEVREALAENGGLNGSSFSDVIKKLVPSEFIGVGLEKSAPVPKGFRAHHLLYGGKDYRMIYPEGSEAVQARVQREFVPMLRALLDRGRTEEKQSETAHKEANAEFRKGTADLNVAFGEGPTDRPTGVFIAYFPPEEYEGQDGRLYRRSSGEVKFRVENDLITILGSWSRSQPFNDRIQRVIEEQRRDQCPLPIYLDQVKQGPEGGENGQKPRFEYTADQKAFVHETGKEGAGMLTAILSRFRAAYTYYLHTREDDAELEAAANAAAEKATLDLDDVKEQRKKGLYYGGRGYFKWEDKRYKAPYVLIQVHKKGGPCQLVEASAHRPFSDEAFTVTFEPGEDFGGVPDLALRAFLRTLANEQKRQESENHVVEHEQEGGGNQSDPTADLMARWPESTDPKHPLNVGITTEADRAAE